MPLGNQRIEQIAKLARLYLTPQELDRLSTELGTVVAYFQQLQEVDTSDIQLKSDSAQIENAGCDDMIAPSLKRLEALRNAPSTDGEFFLVPRVMR